MPRLIDTRRCPHCGRELPDPRPRVCPECAGSLQQRHLKAGCLHSGPALLLVGWGLYAAARMLARL
jgi:predicted amidophosphoribosyltransferase